MPAALILSRSEFIAQSNSKHLPRIQIHRHHHRTHRRRQLRISNLPHHLPNTRVKTEACILTLRNPHRIVQRGTSGSEYELFTLPHGEWIRLLGRCGLMVEDLIEVQVPPGAANHDFPELPDEWARRWPAEEVWFARRRSAA